MKCTLFIHLMKFFSCVIYFSFDRGLMMMLVFMIKLYGIYYIAILCVICYHIPNINKSVVTSYTLLCSSLCAREKYYIWKTKTSDKHCLPSPYVNFIAYKVFFILSCQKCVSTCKTSISTSLIFRAIHCSGLEDLLLYIASSEDERNFSMHVLEIVSLMFREQVCVIQVSCTSRLILNLT